MSALRYLSAGVLAAPPVALDRRHSRSRAPHLEKGKGIITFNMRYAEPSTPQAVQTSRKAVKGRSIPCPPLAWRLYAGSLTGYEIRAFQPLRGKCPYRFYKVLEQRLTISPGRLSRRPFAFPLSLSRLPRVRGFLTASRCQLCPQGRTPIIREGDKSTPSAVYTPRAATRRRDGLP